MAVLETHTIGYQAQQSYIIVGAGVFGASTALNLKRRYPHAPVVLIDRVRCNPAAASSDLSKIIRADYADILYMKLALEALEAWRNDPLYRKYFHQTGMLFAENVNKGASFLKNYETLGVNNCARLMTFEEVSTCFPALALGNWTGVQKAYYNPESGWGEADAALKAVINEAMEAGVKFVEATVDSVIVENSGSLPSLSATQHSFTTSAAETMNASTNVTSDSAALDAAKPIKCRGVRLTSGTALYANHILLCTGAATTRLLIDSISGVPALYMANRLVACAALSCTVRIDHKRSEFYRGMPVFANLMAHTSGEAIPLSQDGVIKFNCEMSFTNNVLHKPSGQIISIPPPNLADCTWTEDVPEVLKEDALKTIKGTYGFDSKDTKIESYRICWDAITESQNWIISPHNACSNLFIAAGGSFHAWKFLPVLGQNIVDMMEGRLSPDKAARWAWNAKFKPTGGACDSYSPKRDIKDTSIGHKTKWC